MKNYHQLTMNERELIFLYHAQGKSNREIGKLIGRNHGTITRELGRNSLGGKDGKKNIYSPSLATKLARDRKLEAKIGTRKLDDPAVAGYVIKKLGTCWSPEQIAGRLKVKANTNISYETIYQYIYEKQNKKLKLWELLRHRHPKRELFGFPKTKRQRQIPGRIFIGQRPKEVELRSQVGHWETDNMEGKKKTHGCVSANVERKTALVKLTKLESKKAQAKAVSLITQFEKLPRYLVKTITMDNGTENTQHQQVAQQLKCKTYFCNPYHAWEKGTVENTIGLVRQYLPKKTDLSKVTQAELNWIAWQLNNRPRKRLGFLTPSEFFYKETGWIT